MKGRKSQPDGITIEQYNKELDEAMERVGRGDYTTFEDLEKEMKSRCKLSRRLSSTMSPKLN